MRNFIPFKTPLRLFMPRKPGKEKGFTLVEVIVTLALIALVGTALVPLVSLMFRINDSAASLSQAQGTADVQLAVIESRLRYASKIEIRSGVPAFTDSDCYLYAQDGAIRIKEPGAAAHPLNIDLSLDTYTFGLSFSAEQDSRVIRIDLTVYQGEKQVHKIHSKVYAENLRERTVSGERSGKSVVFTPEGAPVTGITVTAETLQITGWNQRVQFYAAVTPSFAANRGVTWKTEPSARASITQTGLLTPLQEGPVKVIATAADGSAVKGELTVQIGIK